MTYGYFNTKLSRWRKRFRKIDQEASAILVERAAGRSLGTLMELSSKAFRLGESGAGLLAKGMELRINRSVLSKLYDQLETLEHFCQRLQELGWDLWGDNVPFFDRFSICSDRAEAFLKWMDEQSDQRRFSRLETEGGSDTMVSDSPSLRRDGEEASGVVGS